MITRVWRHKNINKKNPEAQLHARKETWLDVNLEKIRHLFHSLQKLRKINVVIQK
jgi:hypothetical protein